MPAEELDQRLGQARADVGGRGRAVKRRAGRRVEVVNRRGLVEVTELTRGGGAVRTARFMASRVVALVEHPASEAAGGIAAVGQKS